MYAAFCAAARAAAATDRVVVGSEVLARGAWRRLTGRTVALCHSASMLPTSLTHVVDEMLTNGVDLAGVLAPEHGFRGSEQAEHGDPPISIDAATNLTVYSVYRMNVTRAGRRGCSLDARRGAAASSARVEEQP